jgi:hypothetical protein
MAGALEGWMATIWVMEHIGFITAVLLAAARVVDDLADQATALRFGCDGLTIQVVSRHELPEPLCFEFATELEPYLHGYRRFVLSWLTFSPPASTTG